ncbi:MAG: HPF/RaiA family ribosome-associated protein [Bacteroidetes bacterium]|nr:HPF/RaiA family ribosome-associated protein [Bacteroidota bacterium]
MNIKINPVHFKADMKLETFIKEKLQKLPVLYEGVIGSEVMLKLANSETRDNKVVEIRLLVRGYDLFAKKQAKTFEEATDQSIEALRKQLIRHKEKIRGL